jgi:cell division protein FtsQ
MWDNPRLLNIAAGALVGVAALIFLSVAVAMLLRSELFPVREMQITTPMKKTTRAEIELAMRGRIAGNFFAVSADEVRAALEKLPWVRSASVRKVWPDRLEAALEEHVALARWGDSSLVNTYGEIFSGKTEGTLPLFIGPPGTGGELARRYARFGEILARLHTPLERIVLTPRHAWQLRLGNGLSVMLGRDADAAEGRLRRFVEVYDLTLKRTSASHEYVDLRYPNGFALRVPGLKG